jgi:hypothetical protein
MEGLDAPGRQGERLPHVRLDRRDRRLALGVRDGDRIPREPRPVQAGRVVE